MIVAIDIGNSNTRIGLFPKQPIPINPQKISNKELQDLKSWLKNVAWGVIPRQEKIDAALIASVVPQKNELFSRVIQALYGVTPKFIPPALLKGAYPELGQDRVANLIAGRELFGLPVCVIDFGTATTIDVLLNHGEYGGGIILPGINLGLRAINEHTALLPKIPIIGTIHGLPLLAKSTHQCIEAGAYWGEKYRIQGLIDKINQTFHPKFVCTGGMAELFAKPLSLHYEPGLTLLGLYFAWKNKYL